MVSSRFEHADLFAGETHALYMLVSYPDPNVRNDDYRLQYNINTVSDNHRYVHLGLGTRLL